MTQHIDLSLVGRVRGREARRKRKRRMVYKGSGRKGGIKSTLSVKSTLFWDFSMHTVLLKDCMFSRVAAASGRQRIDSLRLTSAAATDRRRGQ